MRADDLSILQAASGFPSIILAFRFAADQNGVGRGSSASVSGLAASVIGMAVCLVHCLPTVADAVSLFVGAV